MQLEGRGGLGKGKGLDDVIHFLLAVNLNIWSELLNVNKWIKYSDILKNSFIDFLTFFSKNYFLPKNMTNIIVNSIV